MPVAIHRPRWCLKSRRIRDHLHEVQKRVIKFLKRRYHIQTQVFGMEPVDARVEDLVHPDYQIISYGMIDSFVKDMSYLKHISYSAVAIRLVLVGFLCKMQNKNNENEQKKTNFKS